MSAKIYNFFQSTFNKCSPRHLECGFHIPAELFPLRVKNFFFQGTNNYKRSRNFFKPKFSLDTVSGKQFLREKCTHSTKSGSARTNGSYSLEIFKHFVLGRFLRTVDGNKSPVCASCLRTLAHTHTHTYTHTHTSNKKSTERPGFYYKKLRKISMAFAKSPS